MSTSQDFILLRDLSQGRRATGLSVPSRPYPGLESFGVSPMTDLPPEPAISLERLDAADRRGVPRLTVGDTDISIPTGVGGDFRTEAPAGTYTVVVSRDGYDTERVSGVAVTDGGVADFAVVLLPSSGSEAPIVAVAEPAPDTTEPSTSPLMIMLSV